jgi:ABC-type transporter Mla maintaining outer membrane lipid asymmetry ATPase subunit MlaF
MDQSRRGPAGPALAGGARSGKSTLLHCLAGILVPGRGQVWFGGQGLDTLSDDRRSALRRDRFGFVFQAGQLVPELVTHDARVTACADREVVVRDGTAGPLTGARP